jgi:hypothetical protein
MESQTKLSNNEVLTEQQSALEIIRSLTPVVINKSVTTPDIKTVNIQTLETVFSGIRQTSGSPQQRVNSLLTSLNNLFAVDSVESTSDILKAITAQKVMLDIFKEYSQGSQGVLTEYLMSFLLGAEHIGDSAGQEDIKIDETNIQLKTIKLRDAKSGGLKFRISGSFNRKNKTFTIPPTIIIQEQQQGLIFSSLEKQTLNVNVVGKKLYINNNEYSLSGRVLSFSQENLKTFNPLTTELKLPNLKSLETNIIKQQNKTVEAAAKALENSQQLALNLYNLFIRKDPEYIKPANDNIAIISTVLADIDSKQTKLNEQLDEAESDEQVQDIITKHAEDIGVISVTPNKKVDFGFTVRFESPEDLESGKQEIKKLLKSKGYSTEDKSMPKIDPANDVTDVTKSGSDSLTRLVYKYQIGQREGLAVEHIVAYHLTGKVTPELKDRLDLNPDASDSEVKDILRGDLADTSRLSMLAASKIEKEVGDVVAAESVGSTGNKADLVLTVDNGKKYGLSIKYSSGDDQNKYKVNKNLGYGDEESELVYNPKGGVAWWIVGRKLFLEKLKKGGAFGGKQYNPKSDEFEAPEWMKKAKEDHPDVYRETMSELYERIRAVMMDNLKRKKMSELANFVREANLGNEEERKQYSGFYKLTILGDDVKLYSISSMKPDVGEIKLSGMKGRDAVKSDGSVIIVAVPGMPELEIHSVKFRSNMLSSKHGDLKIKTR